MKERNAKKFERRRKKMKGLKLFLVLFFTFLFLASVPDVKLIAADLNLVNPNANNAAKCLYNYLLSIYKKNCLAGQDTDGDAQWLKDNTGKYPAICGFDMMYYSTTSINNGAKSTDVDRAINWWNNGGIVAFQWHWNAPMHNTGEWYKAFYSNKTNFDVQYALNNPNSDEYKAIITDLDLIATQLKRLQDAGVPVLWRPLHEAEGAWFWWGAKGADACKRLWYLMYDRFTNYHKLNNLVWVWTVNCCSTSLSGNAQYWYPGNDRVDINAVDLYLSGRDYQSAKGLFDAVERLTNYRKMAAIAENGAIPDADRMKNENANWLYFSTWNGSFIRDSGTNELWHTQQVYNHSYIITRDELPNLKNCSVNQTPTNTAIPTNTPTPYIIPGKLECENYKTGGDGVAYHDTDAVNEKGAYRSDGVDIEVCTDADGGYNIAAIQSGEWLAYSLNVQQSGTYNMVVRVASSGTGGTFHITFDGINKSGTLTVPDTGGWQNWVDITVPVTLSTGVQEMRIVVDSVASNGYMGNLNYVNFVLQSPTNTPTYTRTNTPVPPTNTFTRTNTPIPPTNTPTKTATPMLPTSTQITPISTNTPIVLSATPTTPISTDTPVTPSATPTTPIPTNTPFVPTATPTASINFNLTMRSLITNNVTNCPQPFIRVLNTSSSSLNLNNIEVRYWFNYDGTGQGVQAWLNWAGKLPQGTTINNNVQISVVTTNKGTQTHYVSIKFTGGVTLQKNEYAEVQFRFNKSDWSNMQQDNDWSFAAYSNFTTWDRITAYLNGMLVWGNEPTATISNQNSIIASVQSYPNPANSNNGVTLEYNISGSGISSQEMNYVVPDPDAKVKLQIFTSTGRLIWEKELTGAANISAGKHAIYWDGKTSGGHNLAAGTYIFKVTINSKGKIESKTFVILMLK